MSNSHAYLFARIGSEVNLYLLPYIACFVVIAYLFIFAAINGDIHAEMFVVIS